MNILIKVSGEVLQKEGDGILDMDILRTVAKEIALLKEKGHNIAIVMGAGNIFRGRALTDSDLSRVRRDTMGMIGTTINGLALEGVLQQLGLPTKLYSSLKAPNVITYNPLTAKTHLEEGEIVLLSGGTGSAFFSTDSAAALRAAELGCDLILKGTKVDGIYDKDPNTHDDAQFIQSLSFEEAIDQNIRVMDQTAFMLCKENNIKIKVYSKLPFSNVHRALEDNSFGSTVSN